MNKHSSSGGVEGMEGSSIKRPSVKGKIIPMRGNVEFPC
jgi:hypothetical protein